MFVLRHAMQTQLLLNANIALTVVLLLIVIATLRKGRRTKETQDRLIQSLDGADRSEYWIRINVSRPLHFAKRIKLLGFEAKGVLLIGAERIRVLAELPSGEPLKFTFSRDQLELRWVGNAGIQSANLHWISLGTGEDSVMICADTGFNAMQSREATADIWRRIDPAIALPESAKSDFALEKNWTSLTVVVAFFALLGFALLNGVFINPNELLDTKLSGGMTAMVLVALPCYWWLTKKQVPGRESLMLAMLFGVSMTAAYYPAFKRADQILSDGAHPFDYTLMADATLEPVIPGPPKLDYSFRKEYWAQFKTGSTHSFKLIHGPLGLWQIDRSELREKMREFYETAKLKREGSKSHLGGIPLVGLFTKPCHHG